MGYVELFFFDADHLGLMLVCKGGRVRQCDDEDDDDDDDDEREKARCARYGGRGHVMQ